MFFVVLIVLVALLAYGLRPRPRAGEDTKRLQAAHLGALLAGLLAATPFLTTGPVGTSEAYNYSLSLADAVTQFRHGQVPMLAGQTEFAFNGRVHPLRTAPYLAHVAGLLDLIAFRQLGFWALQNLLLALSLVAGGLTCFWGLRRATPASPVTAAALAALYVFSPPVLAAAYGMDLYMTLATLPYLPVVVALGIAAFSGRQPRELVRLAAALAATWWAHPPVALWLTLVASWLILTSLVVHRPTWREWPVLFAVAVLFVVLAGFSFASALTIAPLADVTKRHDLSLLFTEVRRAFPGSLRPVSATANQLGDFQLGYAVWGLALVSLGLAIVRRARVALVVLGTGAFLFCLAAPVPGVHEWLWHHAPAAAFNLTNQWPMQRLYLIVVVLVIFAFAAVWRTPTVPWTWLRDALRLALAAAVLWTGAQGWRFLRRGFFTQEAQEAIARGHASSNINLTPISYALFGLPGSFVNGPMDPAFEPRLLAPYDAHPVASNWDAPLPPLPENRTGELLATAADQPEVLNLTPAFMLQPGARYRLSLQFLAAPGEGVIQLRGPTLFRQYPLPSAGGPRGFGMQAGNNSCLTLWSDQATPEEITLRVAGASVTNGTWLARRPFARYTWERIDPAALPIEVQSLDPFRARVRATTAGYLETPRIFLPGYTAQVNGQAVRVQPSPEGLLMLPVPAGESAVELRYVGPAIARAAFWIGVAGWLAVGLGLALNAWRPAALGNLGARGKFSRRTLLLATASMLVVASAGFAWKKWTIYRDAAGPIRIRFTLPRGETNRQQPLLVTGRHSAGTFIYALYLDAEHVRIGIDVWGLLGYQTDPIRVDYFAEHEIEIDAGALYPVGHPKLSGIPEPELAARRRQLRISFDDQPVFAREINTYEARPSEVSVGRNPLGGSSCEPTFAGRILEVTRLPVARP